VGGERGPVARPCGARGDSLEPVEIGRRKRHIDRGDGLFEADDPLGAGDRDYVVALGE
jgi:hypothetical protein